MRDDLVNRFDRLANNVGEEVRSYERGVVFSVYLHPQDTRLTWECDEPTDEIYLAVLALAAH